MPWLPPPRDGDVPAAIAVIVGKWLADWIAQPPPVSVEAIPAPDGGIAGWQGRFGAWCRADVSDGLVLGNLACAGRADADNPLDERVLGLIGSAMMDDLIARTGREGGRASIAFPPASLAADTGPEFFRVFESAGGWCLWLALDAACIVQARKAAAGSARQPAVVPLATALAGEDVALGCHLGEAPLTIADVAALSIGDVVVLDRAIDGLVPLTIAGFVPQAGAARIGSEAGTIHVTVTETPNLLRKN